MTAQASPHGRHALAVLIAAAVAAIAAVVLTVTASASAGRSPRSGFPHLGPAAAPAGWSRLTLPDGHAQLSFPPSLHPVAADADAVSAAQLTPHGLYEAYLNATPKQGNEAQRTWASFRLRLLRADNAVSAHPLAAAQDVRFRGGTGACVMDVYVTRIGHHSYQEIACLVQGRSSASVIVAAAPTAHWAQDRPVLLRALAAYQVR
jgi:hypothetical protein